MSDGRTETTLQFGRVNAISSAVATRQSKAHNRADQRRLAESNRCWASERHVPVNAPLIPGWIYFAEGNGRIKIGWTLDPASRIQKLERITGEFLYVWAVIPGTRADERAFHQRWTRLALGHEWFRVTPDLLAEAARLGESTPVNSRRDR